MSRTAGVASVFKHGERIPRGMDESTEGERGGGGEGGEGAIGAILDRTESNYRRY